MKPGWRPPVAATASVLVAVAVYRIADRVQHPQVATPAPRLAALDRGSLIALDQLVQAVVPSDASLSASLVGTDRLLAALEWSGVTSVGARPAPPRVNDLGEADLNGLEGLVGGP